MTVKLVTTDGGLVEEEIKMSETPGRRKRAEAGVIGSITEMVTTVQKEILDCRDVTLEQLIFMTQNDGQAKGILNAIKYPVRMARPKIKPAEGGEEEQKFIEKNLLATPAEGGMSTSLRVAIARMALAVRDGYKIFEKVWRYEDGKYWLDKLAYRSTLCTRLLYDSHGTINGARQETTFQEKMVDVKWKADKIAYFIYNAEENPYMGEGDFFPVFYHYDKKHKLYSIAHLAYQLNAVPIRIGTHPTQIKAESLEKFRESLRALGTSVAMTMPQDCEVEKFESDRKLTEFMALIQHHDSMMSRAFLTQFMNLGQEGRGGSFALSKDQSNLFLMSLMSLLEDIAEVFNTQVIPQLIDWNFGTEKYPRLIFSPFSDTIRSAIMDVFKNLLAARFPQISPEFAIKMEEAVAEELGIEIDYKEVEARMEKEREAMEAGTGEGEVVEKPGEDKKKAPETKVEETDKELSLFPMDKGYFQTPAGFIKT
jgi:hypothetical protein